MKIIRFIRIPCRGIPLLIVLIFCIPLAAQAQVSITDTWAESGRLAVEGADWSVVFSKEEGALLVYSRTKETVRIVPFFSEKSSAIASCKVIEDEGNKGIEASFSAGQDQIEGNFFFDRGGSIHIRPSRNMKGILVSGEISFGVVPTPPLEDLIYDPSKYTSASQIHLPPENLFLGLLKGEDRLFFCAWPEGHQKARLVLEDGGKDERLIKAFEIQLDGKSAYLRSTSAPGIWHREEFLPTDMENDKEIDWKRPFPARWKTQILEGKIETAFPFMDERENAWRPNFGFYVYPVWFEGDKTFFHFSKKIPPQEQALIYALEGHKDAPVDFAKEHISDVSTLKPRIEFQTYPENNLGIRHCDGRAWVKWIFKLGFQTREKEFLQEVMADFLYSISVEKVRLEEYEAFIPGTKEKIDSWIEQERDDPELELLLGQFKERVEKLEKEYWDKMDNSPASEHLQEETEVISKLKVLIEEEGLEVYPEACYLLDKIQLWSLMESVPGGVGGLLRELFQQAGYDCAHNEAVTKYAVEIRKDIRAFLINGETYETIYPRLWD
jgi:hypothetical protein